MQSRSETLKTQERKTKKAVIREYETSSVWLAQSVEHLTLSRLTSGSHGYKFEPRAGLWAACGAYLKKEKRKKKIIRKYPYDFCTGKGYLTQNIKCPVHKVGKPPSNFNHTKIKLFTKIKNKRIKQNGRRHYSTDHH